MADKRISQLVDRGTIANNDVVPIVVSGAVTTNKATISSIQTFMQGNLDLGVTSVGITLGSTGTDVNVTGSPITTSGNITINIPDASATARGVVTTGTQTFGGLKTFANGLLLPSAGGTNQASRFVNTGSIHQGSAGSNIFGFNNSNNIYFGKGLDNGGVIQWNNSAVRYYTLPDADGTIALASDFTGFVTLGTAQTITAQKTFTTSGGSDTMIISHGSGSGFALDVIKAGNGEAIRVTKTSGSGNAMTVIGGNFEAPTIVRTGGTSSQFLMADGSVNTNVLASGAYLPLTGGTLTGALNGTSAVFSSTLGIGTAATISGVDSLLLLSNTSANGKNWRIESSSSGTLFFTQVGVVNALQLAHTTGAATFSGALNGTSAVFSGNAQASKLLLGTSTANSYRINIVANSDFDTAGILLTDTNTGGRSYAIGSSITTIGSLEFRDNTAGQNRLTISSTGAATFSSSVTAGGFLGFNVGNTNGIIRRTTVNGSNGIRIQGNANDTISDTNAGSSIFVGGGVIGDTFEGSIVLTAYGSVADNNRNQIIFENRSGVNTVTERMRINHLGNLGIGTATPGEKLHVDGGNIIVNSAQAFGFGDRSAQIVGNTGSSGFLRFDTNNGERMRITSGGKLLIGTTSDTFGLFTSQRVIINPLNDGITVAPLTQNKSAYTVQSDNNTGSRYALYIANGSSNEVGSISFTSSLVLYNTTSDYRLKEDLQEINGVDKVMAIKVYDYKWINSEDRMDGVLAHELAEVLPYAVNREKDEVNEQGDILPQGVDYSKIVPILIKAIQEQQEQINQLKNQIK